jgi:penicillin-binding protein 1A
MKGKLRSVFKLLGWCAAVFAVLLLVGVIAGLVVYQRYSARAAKFDLTKIDAVPERSAIYDAYGEHYSYFGGENRLVVPLSAVSKNFLNALIAREDSRFWEHHGVDWRGVFRAALANARAGEIKQGGSTITQQLARNACDLRTRTLDRKALEAALAARIERIHSKEQILELYVNRIYFGSSCYGIEAAARGYFGKSAADLTLAEGATLAALIRNPKRLSPRNRFEDAWAARNVVVDRMRELHLISEEEALAAKAQQIRLARATSMRATDDDVTDAVLQELETLLASESIQFGGLKVFMTIDPQLQKLAQAAADRRLTEIEETKGFPHPKKRDFAPSADPENDEKQTDYLQAAVVAIDNRTGAIRAAVGGRDYAHSKYSRALQAKRQVGSTFKPFVYAAAFERGLLPGNLIEDSPIRAGEFRDVPKNWSPENSDDEYGGPTPAAVGLLKSRNTMSVRVGELAGLSKVRELGQSAGLGDDIPEYPVVFLGGFEATVKDLAAAYTIFPNLGTYRRPFLISSIEDRDGHILWRAPSEQQRVISPDTAWMTSSILQDVMKSGTAAKSASLGWKKIGAGKTGTTNDFHDAWFVGFTSSLTCAVWVGMDQPQTIFNKGYGSALALPVWVDFMQQVQEKDYPAAPFEPPSPAIKATLCSASGARATSVCVAQRCAYETVLPASRVPSSMCPTHPEPVVAPAVVPPPAAPAFPPSSAPIATMPAAPPPTRALTPSPVPPPIAEYTPDELSPPPVQADRRVIVQPPAHLPGSSTTTPVTRQPSATAVVPESANPSQPVASPRTTRREANPMTDAPPMPAPDKRSVEVRRAVPIEKSSSRKSDNDDNAESKTNQPIGERTVVERLPDGRVRTTTTRTVQTPGQDAPEQPAKRSFRLFKGGNDDEKDDEKDDD